MKKLLITLGLLTALAVPALAQDKPLLSTARLSLAAGADYSFGNGFVEDQIKVGAFAAYNLTPHLSLTGSTVYGLKTEDYESRVGLRLRVWRGN